MSLFTPRRKVHATHDTATADDGLVLAELQPLGGVQRAYVGGWLDHHRNTISIEWDEDRPDDIAAEAWQWAQDQADADWLADAVAWRTTTLALDGYDTADGTVRSAGLTPPSTLAHQPWVYFDSAGRRVDPPAQDPDRPGVRTAAVRKLTRVAPARLPIRYHRTHAVTCAARARQSNIAGAARDAGRLAAFHQRRRQQATGYTLDEVPDELLKLVYFLEERYGLTPKGD